MTVSRQAELGGRRRRPSGCRSTLSDLRSGCRRAATRSRRTGTALPTGRYPRPVRPLRLAGLGASRPTPCAGERSPARASAAGRPSRSARSRPSSSANHRLPSGPAAVASRMLPGPGRSCPCRPTGIPSAGRAGAEYSVICPDGVIRPIAGVAPASVNHRLPSGPAAIPTGSAPGFRPVGELGDLPRWGDPPDRARLPVVAGSAGP